MRYWTFLLFLGLISCSEQVEKRVGPDSLSYKTDTLLMGDQLADGIHFQVEDLVILDSNEQGLKVAGQIKEHLVQNNVNFDEEFQSYQSLFESLKTERQTLSKGGYDNPAPWDLQQGIEVFVNENGLFGVHSFHSSYTGGAHSNYYRSSLLFRLSDGQELKLDSILSEGSLHQLNSLAEAKLRAQKGLDEKDPINTAGFWFKDSQFHLSEQFTYQKEGLTLFYNPYEIGPYSMGMVEIFIPYVEIHEMIRPEYRFEIKIETNT